MDIDNDRLRVFLFAIVIAILFCFLAIMFVDSIDVEKEISFDLTFYSVDQSRNSMLIEIPHDKDRSLFDVYQENNQKRNDILRYRQIRTETYQSRGDNTKIIIV